MVSAVVVGSAVHDAMQAGLEVKMATGDFPSMETFLALYEAAWAHQLQEDRKVWWVNTQEQEYDRGRRGAEAYHPILSELLPLQVETKFSLEIPGVALPVVGYIDHEVARSIYDVKTSTRPIKTLKAEWRLQDRLYKLATKKDALWHIVVCNKESAYVLTEQEEPNLVSLWSEREDRKTEELVRRIVRKVEWAWQAYGPDNPWEGAITTAACGDCGFRRGGCPWWQ